ncbi:MAG: hypothetical protein ACXAC7_23130, partial [Candidatus Hodarchaeales archaeon]
IYWESDQNNPWYWRKLGNEVEITSYATWALAIDDYIDNYALIQKSVRYLLNQRNRWGWRTTADTAAAITALTAIKNITFNGGLIDFNGTISVNINNNDTPQFLLNLTENRTDVTMSLDVFEELMDPEEIYTKIIPSVLNGTEISFSLIAPSMEHVFILEGVSVTGFIQYSLENSSSYQLFQQTVGPVFIRVGSQSPSVEISPAPLTSSSSESSQQVTLAKNISKHSFLTPGEIITVSILISNNGEQRQFYVLEDEIPTGTVFLNDSVQILGNYENIEISHDKFTSGVHVFFPILSNGTTQVSYELQVENIKNSYSGQCKLWGMYDDMTFSTQSIILENIPRKFYANHSIYLDTVTPIITNLSIEQNRDSPEKQLFINFKAVDDSGINKIRVIFSQNNGWRSQILYSRRDQELFSVVITEIENADSKAKVYMEVSDNYGNLLTSNLMSIKITLFEFIPYILIGIIVGFSVGLASIASIMYKKYQERKPMSKSESGEISFLDDNEEL